MNKSFASNKKKGKKKKELEPEGISQGKSM